MKIKHTNSLNAEDIEFLTAKINEEAKEEYGSAFPFAFFIRNQDDQTVYF